MKKLILLLFIPLLSFSQVKEYWGGDKTKIKSITFSDQWSEKVWLYDWENGALKMTMERRFRTKTYPDMYGISDIVIDHQYKGFFIDIRQKSPNWNADYIKGYTKSGNPIFHIPARDGIARWYDQKKGPCAYEIYLGNNLIKIIWDNCSGIGKSFLEGFLDTHSTGNDKDYKIVDQFDITSMVNVFIDNIISVNNLNKKKSQLINLLRENRLNNNLYVKATFEALEGNTLAAAFAKNIDNQIIVKVDPVKWQNASEIKRWYTLYHELGHDILNLDHGEGGRMMFNFAPSNYTWQQFFDDRDAMFNSFFKL